jgi:hypothetical protein
MSFLKNLFGAPPKQRTMLDDAQEAGSKVIVIGYRRIAAQLGCAPTAKTTDQKIVEIYSRVGTAFQKAAEQRGEHIPALYLNTIVLKFIKVHEMFYGSPFPQRFQEHLQYEVNKYLAEGLRPDYKQELPLFDPDDPNDPDVKRLKELHRLTREKLENEVQPKENKPPVLSDEKIRIPYIRIASWLVGASTMAGFIICELLVKEKIVSKEELEKNNSYDDHFYDVLCTAIASFYAANIIRLIMEARHVVGRQDFAQIYKELNIAIGEVATTHPLYDKDSWPIGYVAAVMTNWERHDSNFTSVLNYFEGNLAEFGISPEEIDYYAKIHGSIDAIKNLDSFCLCILIFAQRMIDRVLIGKTISAEKHSLSMEIVCQGILKEDEVGFVGLSNAAINLLESGADDKPISELKSEKQIREDMACFSKT